jgi:Flp pilus assembly pilin Flp
MTAVGRTVKSVVCMMRDDSGVATMEVAIIMSSLGVVVIGIGVRLGPALHAYVLRIEKAVTDAQTLLTQLATS